MRQRAVSGGAELRHTLHSANARAPATSQLGQMRPMTGGVISGTTALPEFRRRQLPAHQALDLPIEQVSRIGLHPGWAFPDCSRIGAADEGASMVENFAMSASCGWLSACRSAARQPCSTISKDMLVGRHRRGQSRAPGPRRAGRSGTSRRSWRTGAWLAGAEPGPPGLRHAPASATRG